MTVRSTTRSAATPDGWLDRAHALAPIVEQYRDQCEQERRIARPLFDALRETGMLDMLTPRALGGPQADYETFLRVVEELSRQDGSVGWCAMIWIQQGLFADYLEEDVARELLGVGRGNLICGSVSPTGRATPVASGLRVSGRWPFASGCHYATWLVAGCVVLEDGHPRLLDAGEPDIRLALLPATDYEILDTWHTAGLRGTGSHDFQADGVVVPSERTIPLPALFAGPTIRPGTMYRTPFVDLAGTGVAAVGLGIARAAIEAFIALAGTTTPVQGTTTLAALHTIQQQVGKAEARLRAARAYLYDTLRDVLCAHQAGVPVDDEHRAAQRLASTHAAACAVEVVDAMFDAGGGRAIYASNRLERCFRDVHMITHHMAATPLNYEMVGQYLLGGPLQRRR